jgi:formamidopyrimidine-DNA glycosylase
MPELHEVEAQRLMLEAHAVGHRVAAVVLTEQGGGPRDGSFEDKVIAEGVSLADFSATVEGAFILSARRRGKQLWLELGSAPTGPPSASLLVHLGMTGSLLVRGVAAPRYKSFSIDDAAWPPRFTKLEMTLSSGATIAYTDPRRFGRILLRGADATASPPLSALAKDPIIGPPIESEFREVLLRLSSPIKAALLD